MGEAVTLLLGLLAIASWVYMMVAQFKSIYRDRSVFEKVVTWFSIVTFILYLIGTISEQPPQ